MTDLLIIGAGPAGLTAALYALRYGLSVILLEKNMYGGQMALTNNIENYPGFDNISGIELSERMYNHVLRLGGKFFFEEVKKVELGDEKKYVGTDGHDFYAKSIIIANGLRRKKLNVINENKFLGKGISYCATCDGNFFRGKDVAVVGGGNVALEDAIYLSNVCRKVYLLVRKGYFRAERHLINIINNKKNIEKIMNTNIIKISGKTLLENITLNRDGHICDLNIEGLFIAIGYEPDNNLFRDQILTDDNGYFISDDICQTNIKGVYVAGDCRKKDLRQIVTAISDGSIAGNQVMKYLSGAVLGEINKTVVGSLH